MEWTDFFFLRPYWLLLLIPAFWLVWLAMRQVKTGADHAWSRLVDAHLLAALSVGKRKGKHNRWLPMILGIALGASTIAMAGPTWQKIHQPTHQSRLPAVVTMSLAQSMNADDVKPTRLMRAGHKLRDILEIQNGGDVGLVIYSDRPFVAAPLTEDREVIREMLPELSTDLMPVVGNNAHLAIAEAAGLLRNAGAMGGNIVLLTDSAGGDLAASIAAAKASFAQGYRVNVIGIGTYDGAPIQTASGRAITGSEGTPMQAGFDEASLRRISAAGGGIYSTMTPDGSDVAKILPNKQTELSAASNSQDQFRADGWADIGYWLVLVPILLAPLAFRRNVLLAVPIALALLAGLPAGQAQAADLAGLWQTPNQRGATAFAEQDYSEAAQKFEDNRWRAAAYYRAGEYAEAANELSEPGTMDDAYNRGNALARSGDLEGALGAYDKSLEMHPDDTDTRFNRDLVARLLEQQQQQDDQQQTDQQQGGQGQDEQQANQQQGGQDQDGQQASQQQGGQDQQQQGSQGQDQQQADQQQQGNQGQDQQQADQQQQGSQGQDQQQADQLQGSQGQDQQQADYQQGSKGRFDEQEGRQEQSQTQARSGAELTSEEKSAFQKAMDAILKGNAGDSNMLPKTENPVDRAGSGQGITEQEQANEQLLRSVPDDASGLLRARIRQHYARYR